VGHELIEGGDEAGDLLEGRLAFLADHTDVGALFVPDLVLVGEFDQFGLLVDDDAVVVEQSHGRSVPLAAGEISST
jgi:hypothetical protein